MSIILRDNGSSFPSLVDEFFKPSWNWNEGFSVNVPACNIKETEKSFTLELAAPGRKKDDFQIEIDNDMLSISSEQSSESQKEEDDGRYSRKEFSYSSFTRSFSLPESVNMEKIDASYKDGVLHITLPKMDMQVSKSKKRIDIK
jgi:HSP20 family protein